MAEASSPPQPMIGDLAPPFDLTDSTGAERSLVEWQGKFVVLHFGASW